jgi:hypothetical protein
MVQDYSQNERNITAQIPKYCMSYEYSEVMWPILLFPFLKTTLCDKVCQSLATGRWFSLSSLVSSTYKTDRHDITEILLKVALNTDKQAESFQQ